VFLAFPLSKTILNLKLKSKTKHFCGLTVPVFFVALLKTSDPTATIPGWLNVCQVTASISDLRFG
jgi:hypothetical protein